MNRKVSKIIKITAISVGGLIAAVLAVIGIAINFVFTPEKLTPVVVNMANNAMNAHLDIERVELTFFSTFPQFGLEIKEGTLVSKALRDTLFERTDSLATFGHCLVELNPIDYLTHQKINIKNITLSDAEVYAFRNGEGKANWDIALSDSTAETADTTTTAAIDIKEIAVNGIFLKNSNIVFDDRNTQIYARMDGANVSLKAALNKNQSQIDLAFDNKNILFWQKQELLVNHIHTALNTKLDFDHRNKVLTLHGARLDVNGMALDVKGSLSPDSLKRVARTDLEFSLHAPSLATVLDMIPESIVKKGAADAQGEVYIEGKINGLYGNGQLPIATLGIKINKASAHYKGMAHGIDNIDLDFHAYVDLMRKKPSYADLKIFRFEGAHTTVIADAYVNHLLTDPNVKLNIKAGIDLTALAQTFPLQEGISLKGGIDAHLGAQFRLSSLQHQDLGRIRLQGQLAMKDMLIADVNKGFELSSDASFDFTGDDQLTAALAINEIQLKSKTLQAKVNQMKANLTAGNPQDTTRIVPVKGAFEVNEARMQMGDSLRFFGNHAKATIDLHESKDNILLPEIGLSLDADSLYGRVNETKAGMDKGGLGLRITKLNDSIWTPSGIVGFHRLMVSTPEMKLPVELRQTKVTVKRQDIMLKNAHLVIGKSDLVATGAIYNIYEAMKKRQPLKAKLSLTSNNLDGNQLINALNTANDSIKVTNQPKVVAETAADSVSDAAPMELFILPDNIDFELQTQLKKVTYGKMLFENVRGAVDVRDQAIHLKNLSMRGLDADMSASLVYHANEKKKGYTGFDFKLKDVNIGKLVDFIPSLDEMVPMLRSFKGIVNFDAAAEAELDSALNIKIPSLRAAIHIKGDSLVLMDGETFAEISKMMMFKNKKRNLIDSIYVNMTVDKGNVTVYPFVVQMDRYRAAVGGTQDLDMNFKYHISVLKSPVPFKLGVNITGNLDKMKFRIGKAKYKDMVTPVAIRKVDSTRINLGENIVRDFEKVMQNARKK